MASCAAKNKTSQQKHFHTRMTFSQLLVVVDDIIQLDYITSVIFVNPGVPNRWNLR